MSSCDALITWACNGFDRDKKDLDSDGWLPTTELNINAEKRFAVAA